MKEYKAYFKGKKITVMGLGLLGKGYLDPIFLAQCGADIIATDLKTAQELAPTVQKLQKYKNIKLILGGHRFEDFENRDFILKNQGIPLDSPYIAHARAHGVAIEMDESLFAKYAPGVTIIGITGTRGKTTTTHLIYEILAAARGGVHLAGNLPGKAALPLLAKVKEGDIVVMELSSWQLQGFGDAKISPQISVFTTFMPDHMNYYKNNMNRYFADKAYIFKYQTKNDALIIQPEIKKLLPKDIKSNVIIARKKDVEGWKFNIPGEHNKANLACAVAVANLLGVPLTKIKKAVSNFVAIEGRLQYVKTVRGIKIYNDNNATTPQATVAALESLGDKNLKKLILIAGGADKHLDVQPLGKAINTYCKSLILLNGTGTDRLLNETLKVQSHRVNNLKDAVESALKQAQKGDTVILSPAFASFGMFTNEYDRNDQFMKLVKKLK
jgi:UDP-N-acetylmuramoylalanine--D-glutamate ligase